MSNLPIKEERHEEEHPVCVKCGSEMVEIGEKKVYDELFFVPGEFFVCRHIVKNTSVRNAVRNLKTIRRILMRLRDARSAVQIIRSR